MPPGVANSTAWRETGSASVEFVAVVPFLLLAILVAAQIGVAGQALWSAGIAARAGARASLIGSDAADAARAALPPGMRDSAVIDRGNPLLQRTGGMSIRVPVPTLIPGLPGASVTATTSLGGNDN